jgi:hypothetical protein
MRSETFIRNKFDGNEYRVSIAKVRKRISLPNPLERAFPELAGGKIQALGLGAMNLNNIILEAAIFPKNGRYKPQFLIALDDGYSEPTTKEEFTKFVLELMANERLEELMNGKPEIYKRHNLYARGHDLWQLIFLSKVRIVFPFRDPKTVKTALGF